MRWDGMAWYGMVWHGVAWAWHGMVWYGQQHQPKGTQHVQAMSKEDKIKLEPSVAGYVDGIFLPLYCANVWTNIFSC